jgi:hypothetical protein
MAAHYFSIRTVCQCLPNVGHTTTLPGELGIRPPEMAQVNFQVKQKERIAWAGVAVPGIPNSIERKSLDSRYTLVLQYTNHDSPIFRLPFNRLVGADLPAHAHRARRQHVG